MHILQGDYRELFRTHQKNPWEENKAWAKEDFQDEATSSAHGIA